MDCRKLKPEDICVTKRGNQVQYIGCITIGYDDVYRFIFFNDEIGLFQTDVKGLQNSCYDEDNNIIKKKLPIIKRWLVIEPNKKDKIYSNIPNQSSHPDALIIELQGEIDA